MMTGINHASEKIVNFDSKENQTAPKDAIDILTVCPVKCFRMHLWGPRRRLCDTTPMLISPRKAQNFISIPKLSSKKAKTAKLQNFRSMLKNYKLQSSKTMHQFFNRQTIK